MKIGTCEYEESLHLAIIESPWDSIEQAKVLLISQHSAWPREINTVQQYIENAEAVLPTMKKIVANTPAKDWLSINDVKLCAPIPVPIRNVICLGWNYAEHAKESSSAKGIQIQDLPQYPIIFTKATTTVNGPYDDVIYDSRVSKRLDWEVELGVIIGKSGRHISTQDALDHVFGYTVINDISARDLQKRHQQFFMGKSVDGTCPMGPWIVTVDEIDDPQNLMLQCAVNAVVKQQANTDQQIFPVAEIICSLSKVMTLLPGDIIATGTPSGVGFARTPPEYLQPDDMVECQVECVGSIRNTIVLREESI